MFSSFIANISSSIYDPAFYKRVFEGARTRTFSFMFLFSVLVTIITGFITLPGIYSLRDTVASLPQYVQAQYPDGLVLTMKDSVLSTSGVPEPVTLWQFPVSNNDASRFTSLATIDTQTPYTLDGHKASGSVFWIGRDAATVFKDDDGSELQTVVYKEEAKGADIDFTITKADVVSVAQFGASFAPFVIPVCIAFLLVFYVGMYMSGMFFTGLFIGFLLWLGGKVFSMGWGFKPSVRAAIFAGVLGNLIGLFSWFMPFTLSTSLYVLLTLGIVLLNVRNIPQVTPPTPAPTPSV